MKRNQRLVQAVAEWELQNRLGLAESGLETTLVGPTTGSSKDSATLNLVSRASLTSATVWDSGEAELITVQVSSASEPVIELGALDSDGEVFTWLDHVAARHQT